MAKSRKLDKNPDLSAALAALLASAASKSELGGRAPASAAAGTNKGGRTSNAAGLAASGAFKGLDKAQKHFAVLAVRFGNKHGVPPSVLMSQLGIESSWGANTVGPSTPYGNARGPAQFIPGTRKMMIDNYGVDPWKSDAQAVEAQAILLKTSGWKKDPRGAVYAYNHSQAYVDDVLNGAKDFKALDGVAAGTIRGARMKVKPSKEMVATPTGPKPRNIVQIGHAAEHKFGLTVGEHPKFGGVAPVHTGGSFHYSNDAIDVSGDASSMMKFDKWLAKNYGDDLEELFYDPGISMDEGSRIGDIGGHTDHVHVAESTVAGPSKKAYARQQQQAGGRTAAPTATGGAGSVASLLAGSRGSASGLSGGGLSSLVSMLSGAPSQRTSTETATRSAIGISPLTPPISARANVPGPRIQTEAELLSPSLQARLDTPLSSRRRRRLAYV